MRRRRFYAEKEEHDFIASYRYCTSLHYTVHNIFTGLKKQKNKIYRGYMHTYIYTTHDIPQNLKSRHTQKTKRLVCWIHGLFPDPCCLKSSDAAQILYHMLHSFFITENEDFTIAKYKQIVGR